MDFTDFQRRQRTRPSELWDASRLRVSRSCPRGLVASCRPPGPRDSPVKSGAPGDRTGESRRGGFRRPTPLPPGRAGGTQASMF